MSTDASDAESVGLKIMSADSKPLHCVADEVQAEAKSLFKTAMGRPAHRMLLSVLPTPVGVFLTRLFAYLGSEYGLSVEALGAVPYPLGVCTIVSAPVKGEESIDCGLNLAMIPGTNATTPPCIITLCGISLRSTYEDSNPSNKEKKFVGMPVLDICISLDSRAVSMNEGRKFCVKFQQNMTSFPWELKGKKAP